MKMRRASEPRVAASKSVSEGLERREKGGKRTMCDQHHVTFRPTRRFRRGNGGSSVSRGCSGADSDCSRKVEGSSSMSLHRKDRQLVFRGRK